MREVETTSSSSAGARLAAGGDSMTAVSFAASPAAGGVTGAFDAAGTGETSSL